MEFCRFFRSVTFALLFPGRVLGRLFACGYSGVRVAFFEKLAHLAFVVKIGVVTKDAPQSRKLREWNNIFYELWMRGQM